ncbi:UDP-N-acetylmuramate dehydrogenase [Halalkalibaculum sp. DA384]|uniref:UDP-N-acetylmuramate dehydrogenase n=1 Tax=Halalkalibaculum sp. DA384 TaxID=3373606 RepID=UPI0037540206
MSDTTLMQLKENHSLKPYNTLGVEAKAEQFISIGTVDQLVQVLTDPNFRDIDKCVLGGGSNVLFRDDVKGLVLHISIKGIHKVREDKNHVWVRSGAGVIWHDLVLHCVERGWGGIENLSLIPGTVGAAPIQNIGAYGAELKDVFESLEAVETETGEVRTFTYDECRFGYRDSIFKNELKGKYIITHCTLRLSRHPEVNTSYGAIQARLEERGVTDPTIRDISETVIDIRRSKLPDPDALGNAGSFFKNPVVSKEKYDQLKRRYPEIPGYPLEGPVVKVPAGWLIEETGWKGKVVGNAGTYHNQALVIVNHGGATGTEILQLAEKVKTAVHERFGIELEPEVNIIP